MICKSQIHEELVIGLIRGELQSDQEHSLKNHIEGCNECKGLFDTWTEILQGVDDENQTPSPQIKRKIMRTIKDDLRSIRVKKPTFIIGSTCFAVLMVLIGYTINPATTSQPTVHREVALQEQPFLVNDNTDVYEISHEWNDSVKGYAWINPYSNEMMLLVDGLHPVSINDYQAWIQTADELKNVGLLKVTGQKGQLYIHDRVINHLEHIMVSKEPLGGSPVPTDPNPFLIKLNAK